MTCQFKKGDIVYLGTGEEAEFVGEFDGQIAVHCLLEAEDEEQNPIRAPLQVVAAVFSEPPTDRLHAEARRLREELQHLRQQLSDERRAVHEWTNGAKQREREIGRVAALTRVDDYLAGKITHLVLDTYDVQIRTFAEAMRVADASIDPHGLSLLCLFGKSDGNLQWAKNRWSDGSGDWTTVIPCLSLEEARLEAEKLLQKSWESDNAFRRDRAVRSARKLGIPIPSAVWDAFVGQERAKLEKTISQLEGQALEARKSIAALEGKNIP